MAKRKDAFEGLAVVGVRLVRTHIDIQPKRARSLGVFGLTVIRCAERCTSMVCLPTSIARSHGKRRGGIYIRKEGLLHSPLAGGFDRNAVVSFRRPDRAEKASGIAS